MSDSDSENPSTPLLLTPTPCASIPLRCTNQNNLNPERPIAEISIDNLLIREADLATSTAIFC